MANKEKHLLTIAIPTFDRSSKVAQRLEEISREIVPEVQVVVFENGDTVETRNAVAPYLSSQISYKPSPVNRGFALNVLRCLEESHSTWIWVLGDDDHLLPGAIKKILSWIESPTEDQFVSMRSFTNGGGSATVVKSVGELFANTSFDEALFVSSTIWRRVVAVKHAQAFCDGAFSMGPQLAMMLSIIESEGASATIHPESLLQPKLNEHRWSRLKFISRILSLAEFVPTVNSKKILMVAMLPTWSWAAIDAWKEVDGPAKRSNWIRAMFDGQRVIRRYTGTFTFLRIFGKSALKPAVKELRR